MRARLIGVLVAGLAAAAFFGLGGAEVASDTDRVEAFLTERGVVGPLVFVLAMWLVQPLGPPGFVFMVPAALVWSWPVAVGLSWLGNLGSSTIAFSFARWVGRDWVASRLPPKVAAYDSKLEGGGVMPVLMLRIVTGQLPPADWLLGVSNVRFSAFLIGTAIGIIPGILVIVLAGASLLSLLASAPPAVWGAVAAIGVLALVARRRAASRASQAIP